MAVVTKILLVGSGGFAGSVLRYAAGGLVHRFLPAAMFPAGTLFVNVLGCLCIGVLGGIAETRGVLGAQTRLFLLVGALGGFTTFSTFGFETFALLRDGQELRAVINIAAQVILGLSAVATGYVLSRG